jgi:DNA-binding transcriptional MerR regulator
VAWSIVEVARMARVSSRTLRHYHDVGLLVPAYVGANGYRFYEREQLLSWQQILLLRELDLGLEAIAEVLAGDRDRGPGAAAARAVAAQRAGPARAPGRHRRAHHQVTARRNRDDRT